MDDFTFCLCIHNLIYCVAAVYPTEYARLTTQTEKFISKHFSPLFDSNFILKAIFSPVCLHTTNAPLILSTTHTTVTTVFQLLVSISFPEDRYL